MTRDGLFLVANGLVTGAVRATGEEAFKMVVPAMKIHNFHFSEVTKFYPAFSRAR